MSAIRTAAALVCLDIAEWLVRLALRIGPPAQPESCPVKISLYGSSGAKLHLTAPGVREQY